MEGPGIRFAVLRPKGATLAHLYAALSSLNHFGRGIWKIKAYR